MNIEKKELSHLHEAVTIVLEKQDYQEAVDKSLKNLRKQVQIKGFRPGNVPMPIVTKLYRKSVVVDEVEKIIQNKITNYLKENNLDVLGTPIITENNFDSITETEEPTFKITFEYGIKPEINIKLSKKDKVPYYNIKVDENSINEYLNYYKRTYGENIDSEEVGENSTIQGKIFPKDNPEQIYNENGTILVSMIKTEKIKKSFIGKKKGDIVSFDAEKAMPNKKDLALLLQLKEEELPENLKLSIEITKITDFKEAELNQELWNKIYGQDQVTSYEQFIEKITKEIEEQRKSESEYKLHNDLKNKLLSKAQLDLPEEFLKKQLKQNAKEEITDEVIQNEFPLYLNAVKEQLIYAHLQKEHGIKITEEDMIDGAKKIVINQFRQYGLYQLPEEYINELAPKVLKNEKEADRIFEMKLDEKIIEIVKSLVTLDEQEIEFEDFVKKLKKKKINKK
ncbi:MAG TPA: trigger factor [Bacteroidales bacterium]|nr:trigger factor [Bacteroidales bacterium]